MSSLRSEAGVTGAAGNGWERTESVSRQRFDVWNEVPLAPQTTGMSCWAAAAAMIIGWRERIPVRPEEVAAGAGRWREYRDGLHPADTGQLARAWGLAVELPGPLSVDRVRRLVQEHGPLWVGEASPGLHSVVVAGIHGDGSVDGSFVRINDPWPVGRGERYTLPFRNFARNFQAATDVVGAHAQILHAGGRGGGSRTIQFEEHRSSRTHFSRSSNPFPQEEVPMFSSPRPAGEHESYAAAFGAGPARSLAVTPAGHQYVNTSSSSPDPLRGHGGSGENLRLSWNELPDGVTQVDVVVHLHGYHSMEPTAALTRAKANASGVDLGGRSRPTLGIVPRGRKGRWSDGAGAWVYSFPALLRGQGEGLEELIRWSLAWLSVERLGRVGSEGVGIGRLILTAHSGGGQPLDQLLAFRGSRPACNPNEIHVFDALYGTIGNIRAWARERIAADHARAPGASPTGAARIVYRPGSTPARLSLVVAQDLPGATDPLARWYRAEATRLGHGAIPRRLGGRLLADASADVLSTTGDPLSHDVRPLAFVPGPRALALVDDVRAWRAAPESSEESRAFLRSWIGDTSQSAIGLIASEARRRHFLEEVDWSRQSFPGRGGNSSESTALFAAMAGVVPERRVPTGIRYHNVDSVVQTVPDSGGRKLYPEAKDAFVRAREEAHGDGVALRLGSAWRSESQQQSIRANNPNPAAVARGTSAHTYGLAVDLNLRAPGLEISEISTRSMSNMVTMYRSPVYKWMAIYGDIHGWFPYRNEPWHWEYNPPGFKERFEAAGRTGGVGAAYGTPLGIFRHYAPAETYAQPWAEAAAVVEPEVAYSATSLAETNRIWAEWFTRYGRWRKGVPNTSFFPHSAICCFLLTNAAGEEAIGTGFYIGNNRILTCGHNFYDASDGWTTTGVSAGPGMNGENVPFGGISFAVNDSNRFLHPRWRGQDPDFDLAVLVIPNLSAPNGQYFDIEEETMSREGGVVVSGYGVLDRTPWFWRKQHMDAGFITTVLDEQLHYNIQTVGGHSGSPVFRGGECRTAVAVHTGPALRKVGTEWQIDPNRSRFANRGCRLTREKIAWIRSVG